MSRRHAGTDQDDGGTARRKLAKGSYARMTEKGRAPVRWKRIKGVGRMASTYFDPVTGRRKPDAR